MAKPEVIEIDLSSDEEEDVSTTTSTVRPTSKSTSTSPSTCASPVLSQTARKQKLSAPHAPTPRPRPFPLSGKAKPQGTPNDGQSQKGKSGVQCDNVVSLDQGLPRSRVLAGKTFAFMGKWVTMSIDAAERLCELNGG